MTGLRRNGIALQTMHLPNRKKPCLCIVAGNCATVIGYLRDEDCVEDFWKILDYVAFGNGSPPMEGNND